MTVEHVALAAILVGIIGCISSLVLVSRPPKSHSRIRLQGEPPIKCEMPNVCAITGEPASETHIIRGFSGTPYWLTKYELELPFCKAGWEQYKNKRPLSMVIFKGVLQVFSRIPLFGAYTAIYAWVPFGGIVCGLVSVADLCLHRRQLVIIKKLQYTWKGQLRAVDFVVPSQRFADEFRELNSAETAASTH